jgi:hypothetical protein
MCLRWVRWDVRQRCCVWVLLAFQAALKLALLSTKHKETVQRGGYRGFR